MNLRPFQVAGARAISDFLLTAKQGERRMYSSPTGTGKSIIAIAVQAACPDVWIVTPRVEIIKGFLDKRCVPGLATEDDIVEAGWARQITTPIRLRNALLYGNATAPGKLLLDEGHHDLASTWQDLHALCGYCPAVALTATPFRGTPKGTAKLREEWGLPVPLITFRDAEEQGFLTMPQCKMLPLVDDDVIEIANGELVASQITSETRQRIPDLVNRCRGYVSAGLWDRPTMFACPSREIAWALQSDLSDANLPAVAVTGESSQQERQRAFEMCISCRMALVQVYVVSEGVDLPIRRLIDLSPTLSPVKWVQQFGRATRPGGGAEYVCCNRNLFRHAYVLDGVVPVADLLAAQTAFPVSSARASLRVAGMESLGRIKGADLPLRGGLRGTLYCVSAIEGNAVVDYCAIVHPNKDGVFWARRESARRAGQERDWGTWQKCDEPISLEGYNSITPAPLSDKQKDWWKRAAGRYGLDPTAEVTRKTFSALPILRDVGGHL